VTVDRASAALTSARVPPAGARVTFTLPPIASARSLAHPDPSYFRSGLILHTAR
jgi:hypothetical protein